MKTRTFKLRNLAVFTGFFALIISTNACRKCDDDPTPPDNSDQVDVYVAGGMRSPGYNYTQAVYWKNNSPNILRQGPRASIANDMVITDNRIFAVGSFKDENYDDKPILWANGSEIKLPIYEETGEATSVFVSGNTTYVVGYATTGNFTKGKLWINGEALDAPWWDGGQDTISSRFNSVYVDNNKVYIAGREIKGDEYRVKYWIYEPGNFSPLPPLISAQSFLLNTCSLDLCNAQSIAVKSGHVYVVGYSGNSSSTLWIDGIPTTLDTDLSVRYSVFLENNDVYAAGMKGDINTNKAWYWKNGNINFLNKGDAEIIDARSIATGESNVYVAGFSRKNQDDWATLWVNGIPQSLVPNKERSWAYKIVTVKK